MRKINKIYNLQSLGQVLDNLQNSKSRGINEENGSTKKVGLLGGSFYPPHKGHVLISKKALELGLDLIIWLVVPQNPYKPAYKMNIGKRSQLCENIIGDEEKIIVSGMEAEINSSYSYQTIDYLKTKYPKITFYWLMGLDCLENFHKWEHYDQFTDLVKIMIFNRPNYENNLLCSKAAKVLKPMITENLDLSDVILVPSSLSDLSSTKIREMNKNEY